MIVKFCTTRELQADTSFLLVVQIAKILECVRGEEKKKKTKETKTSQGSGGFSGFYSTSINHYGGGSGSRPAESAHRITRGAPVSSFNAPPT